MIRCLRHAWNDEAGVLSFEWSLLLALLTIGVVGGVVGARDAITDELGDVAEAMLALDDSYTITYPLQITVDVDGAGPAAPQTLGGGSNSGFIDRAIYQDCARVTIANQQ
jgi:Flp pilus assembly pilin Flp